MATRNRHDGKDTPDWWDDLPPAVRRRFAQPPRAEPDESGAGVDRAPPPHEPAHYHRPGILRDLSRLAVLFVIVAIANLLFLLIALSFLVGGPPAKS